MPLEQTRLSLEQHRNASSQELKHLKKIGSSSSLQGHTVTSSGSSTSNAISHDPNSRDIEHLAAQSWEAHQRMVTFRLQRQTVIFTRSQPSSARTLQGHLTRRFVMLPTEQRGLDERPACFHSHIGPYFLRVHSL